MNEIEIQIGDWVEVSPSIGNIHGEPYVARIEAILNGGYVIVYDGGRFHKVWDDRIKRYKLASERESLMVVMNNDE